MSIYFSDAAEDPKRVEVKFCKSNGFLRQLAVNISVISLAHPSYSWSMILFLREKKENPLYWYS